jgi:hypothetical protein
MPGPVISPIPLATALYTKERFIEPLSLEFRSMTRAFHHHPNGHPSLTIQHSLLETTIVVMPHSPCSIPALGRLLSFSRLTQNDRGRLRLSAPTGPGASAARSRRLKWRPHGSEPYDRKRTVLVREVNESLVVLREWRAHAAIVATYTARSRLLRFVATDSRSVYRYAGRVSSGAWVVVNICSVQRYAAPRCPLVVRCSFGRCSKGASL